MKQDLANILDKLYNITELNMGLFNSDNQLVKLYTSHDFYRKIYIKFLDVNDNANLTKKEGRLGIYNVIVDQDSKHKIIIGPFVNKDLNEKSIAEIKYTYSLTDVEIEDLKKEIYDSSFTNYLVFLNVSSLLNYLLNNEDIDIVQNFYKETNQLEPKLNQDKANDFVKESYSNRTHDTYELEQRMSRFIEKGDIEGLQNFFNFIAGRFKFNEGKLAETQLRQQKNIFIGLIAVLGKGPLIRGGVGIEDAYNLIDFYTQECEKLNSIEAINNLRTLAVINFTKKVRSIKKESRYSHDTLKAIDFIQANITNHIGVDEVVTYLQKGRTSFLTKFKEETGISLGKYITKVKLEEAKNLLEFSSTSVLDISIILNFSTQSYFQNVFKKEYGITPIDYRKEKMIE